MNYYTPAWLVRSLIAIGGSCIAARGALATPAPTTTPLSYSTTFTDPSGTPQSVSFTGTASGTSLTGTLTVNGAAEQVTATIGSDGSVSGKLLNPDGSKYGQATRKLTNRGQRRPGTGT